MTTNKRDNNVKVKDVENKEVKKIVKKSVKNKKSSIEKIKGIFKKKTKKKLYSVCDVIAAMLFSLVIGFIICFGCMSLFAGKNYFSIIKDLSKVIDTYYAIVDNYYGDLDKKKLVDSAVEGMINSVGDTFTSYTDSDDVDSFDLVINGNYEGIGATVSTYTDGSIVVIDVFKGSPSDRAGLKVGDIVIKVDNESYEGKNSTDMANYIKNNAKDKVILTVIRKDKEMNITVDLGKVEVPCVDGEIIEKKDKKIGYISISLFSNNSYKQFKDKLEELEDKGIEGLIIDVRDNSGGYLTSVTDICNLFLEKGKIIYRLEDSRGTENKKDSTYTRRNYDVVVIINGSSASASEILASAIKESYDGYVVGTNSYGKGTVQQTKKLLDGSMIKYTTQKWFTPDGNSIDKIGVIPTNYVEFDKEKYDSSDILSDNQIKEAVNILIK